MSCNSCIKGNFDFFTREIDTQAFLYQDMSTWMDGSKFCIPENYSVSVYLPNQTNATVISLKTGCLNKITPSMFGPGYNNGKLMDGVYYFVIDENSEGTGYCGKEFKKSVAIIPALQCCFDKAFLNYSFLRKNEIEHIDFLIKSVRLNASIGNIQAANDYYIMAKKALMAMDCDCLF